VLCIYRLPSGKYSRRSLTKGFPGGAGRLILVSEPSRFASKRPVRRSRGGGAMCFGHARCRSNLLIAILIAASSSSACCRARLAETPSATRRRATSSTSQRRKAGSSATGTVLKRRARLSTARCRPGGKLSTLAVPTSVKVLTAFRRSSVGTPAVFAELLLGLSRRRSRVRAPSPAPFAIRPRAVPRTPPPRPNSACALHATARIARLT
jgi:hypothetical protein